MGRPHLNRVEEKGLGSLSSEDIFGFAGGSFDSGAVPADTHTVTVPDQGTTDYSPIIAVQQVEAAASTALPAAGAGMLVVEVVNSTSFTVGWVDGSNAAVQSKNLILRWVTVKH